MEAEEEEEEDPLLARGDRCRLAKMRVLVDGVPLPRYVHEGKVYVPAVEGTKYAVELKNKSKPAHKKGSVPFSTDRGVGILVVDIKVDGHPYRLKESFVCTRKHKIKGVNSC